MYLCLLLLHTLLHCVYGAASVASLSAEEATYFAPFPPFLSVSPVFRFFFRSNENRRRSRDELSGRAPPPPSLLQHTPLSREKETINFNAAPLPSPSPFPSSSLCLFSDSLFRFVLPLPPRILPLSFLFFRRKSECDSEGYHERRGGREGNVLAAFQLS